MTLYMRKLNLDYINQLKIKSNCLHYQPCCHFKLSATALKQPSNDQKRRLRKIQPPCHNLPFYDENPYQKLRMNQLFSKNINKNLNTQELKFLKIGQILKEKGTLFDKLSELYYHENNMWYHKLDLPLQIPESLNFSSHVTRTVLQSNSLDSGNNDDDKQILNLIEHLLEQEYIFKYRSHPSNKNCLPTAPTLNLACRQEFVCTLMDAIHGYLARLHPTSHLLRHSNQIDHNTKLETFFKRSGYAECINGNSDTTKLTEGLWQPKSELLIDSDNLIRFRLRSRLTWQLRSQLPLAPFEPIEESVKYNKQIPSTIYRPEIFGLEPVEGYSFTCLPFTHSKYSSEYIRNLAGYWSNTPFWKGDNREFGLVGVLDVAQIKNISDDLDSSTLLTQSEKDLILTRHGLSEGVLTAFAWTSAIAYNLGFTMYNDLTYPISVQLLLTDGNNFQVLLYQLNSLSSLWKDNCTTLPVNRAWYSKRLRLYEPLSTNKNKFFVNPEVLSLIVKTLLREPSANQITDLRPYLSVDSTSVSCLIPPSIKLEDTVGQASATSSHLTQAELDALLAVEGKEKKSIVPRLRYHYRPHPNDVFFLRMTEKKDIVDELHEEMPAFGGPSSKLSGSHAQVLDKYINERRWKTLNRKVSRSPRRWR